MQRWQQPSPAAVIAFVNGAVALLALLLLFRQPAVAAEALCTTSPAAASGTQPPARQTPPYDARNRTVVITGSSKGIGRGIAHVFAAAGANVIVNSRHLEEAQLVADEITAAGGAAMAVAGDVSELAAMDAMMDAAAARYGGVDCVIANAGTFPTQKLEDMSAADWDSALSVNLRGTFAAVKAALPHLKRSSHGRILLTSSITGPITGFPGWTHYGAAKAGQLGFMRSAAVELAKHSITVNAVLPGNILTEALAGMGEAYLSSTARVIPLQRIGSVEDIGYACLFLASREAAFITGQALVIDGGQVIPENPSFVDEW